MFYRVPRVQQSTIVIIKSPSSESLPISGADGFSELFPTFLEGTWNLYLLTLDAMARVCSLVIAQDICIHFQDALARYCAARLCSVDSSLLFAVTFPLRGPGKLRSSGLCGPWELRSCRWTYVLMLC